MGVGGTNNLNWFAGFVNHQQYLMSFAIGLRLQLNSFEMGCFFHLKLPRMCPSGFGCVHDVFFPPTFRWGDDPSKRVHEGYFCGISSSYNLYTLPETILVAPEN